MARFDQVIETMTLGNMRELGVGRWRFSAISATTRGP